VAGATDHGMTHSLYIADPDGNEIELYIDVAGVDWNDPDVLLSRPKALRL
jgi:catechol-2,3-dioxygenase